jgi:hypothetical protein
LGAGLVLPYLVGYLADVRGFGLGAAGSAAAVVPAAFVAVGIGRLVIAGSGAPVWSAGGALLAAAGLVLLPRLAQHWEIVGALALVGIGAAAAWPTLPSRAALTRWGAVDLAALGGGAILGGVSLHVGGTSAFSPLCTVAAGTLAAVAVSVGPGSSGPRVGTRTASGPAPGVGRDQVFVACCALEALIASAGFALWLLFPVFAALHGRVGPIGAGVVIAVLAGVPAVAGTVVSLRVERRRRTSALSLMLFAWTSSWLLVAAAGSWLSHLPAFVAFGVAAAVFALAACLHRPTLTALVLDLAPDHSRRRRQTGGFTLAVALGSAVGLAVGAAVMSITPVALWLVAAGVCVAASLAARGLERLIPRAMRDVPRELGQRAPTRRTLPEPVEGSGIVIGGCGRSGTTLLLSILSCHPNIHAIPVETRFLCPGAYAEPSECPPPRLDYLLARARESGARPGQRWCEKTPGNVRCFHAIKGAIPDVRLIHLVRDGRDVVTSRHSIDPSRYWVAPERWVADVELGLACDAALTVRYEDLVADYEATVRAVLEFVGEDWDEALADYPARATIKEARAWGGAAAPISLSTVGRWRAPEHSGAVRDLLAQPRAVELLDRLGYVPA